MKIIWHNKNEIIDYISGNITDTENRIKEIKVRKKERKKKERKKKAKKKKEKQEKKTILTYILWK